MNNKRNNKYWMGRLRKDGHADLLAQFESGDVSMYKARQLAGYLREKASTPADKLSYHWKRADILQREKFVWENREAIARTVRDLQVRDKKVKAQKPSE